MAQKKKSRNARCAQSQKTIQRRRAANEEMIRRVWDSFPDRKLRVTRTPDGVKMSDLLKEFVEPYQKYTATENEYRKLLIIGVAAWNIPLLPLEKRDRARKDVLAKIPEEDRAAAGLILRDLMARREECFSQYRRQILDFELIDEGPELHISVIYSHEPVPE